MSNRVIDCYFSGIGPPESVAANLLAMLGDWWTFDDTLASSGPNETGFAQSYGGSVGYESGLKDDQLVPTQEMQALSHIPNDSDWSVAGWIEPADGTVSYLFSIGVGSDNGLGTDYHAAFFIYADGSLAAPYIRTAGTTGTEQGTYIPWDPGVSRVHFALAWDQSALTLTLYVNGAVFADEVLVSDPPDSCANTVFIRQDGGAAFNEVERHVDELSCYPTYCLTLADAQYLYHSGTGRSYSELVADAT